MNCAYIDTFSGAAGDMLLAALVDAAGERDLLAQVKASLDTIPDIRGEWDVVRSKV